MKLKKKYFFLIKNLEQAIETISICNSYKIVPIFFIKFYLINGFGINWLIEFKNLLLKKFNNKDFMIIVDCKKNYGLFISLVEKKVDYLNVTADSITLKRLKSIAIKNNVTVNPKFSIINLSNIKNIELKINKHIKKK